MHYLIIYVRPELQRNYNRTSEILQRISFNLKIEKKNKNSIFMCVSQNKSVYTF